MRKWVCAALATAGALTVGLGTAWATPKPQTISLLEMDTGFYPTGGWDANPSSAPKVGQGFVSNGAYYAWAGHKRGAPVGHLQVICFATTPVAFTETSATGWFHCDATAFLPGGRIEASGSLSFDAGTNTLPVVGGTGRFVGAQGYVSTTSIGGGDSNNSADVIHITN